MSNRGIREVFAELAASGLTSEQLGLAAELLSLSTIPQRTARQERNRRYYEKHKASENRLNASYLDVSDESDAETSSPNKKAPTPHKKQTPTSPPLVPKRDSFPPSKGNALSAAWEPSEKFWAWADAKGHTRMNCELAMEEMRDWADANRNRQIARKADWDATLKGWVRRRSRPNGRAPPADWLKNAAAETRRKLRKDDEPASRKTIDITPDDP